MDCQQQQDCGKDSDSCSPQWLADRLAFESDQDGGDLTGSETQSSSGGRVLLIDCRPNESYLSVHIRVAVNLALPTLMLRRFIKGQMSVDAVTSHLQQQQQQQQADGDVIDHSDLHNRTLVFYDDCTAPLPHTANGDEARVDATNGNAQQQPLVIVLTQRFRQQGYDAVLLDGGLDKFRQQFPHLCSTVDDHDQSVPVTSSLNRMSLNGDDTNDIITTSKSAGGKLSMIQMPKYGQVRGDDESTLTNQINSATPTIILPYLYIGNAQNAQDFSCLQALGIHFVLNVTNNIPNKFESNDDFHYLRIPINDHWSQNLSSYLPKAVRFIDDARTSKRGVLVHCLAGISRSVTVTVAYLMASHSLSLDLAYDHVKRCRPTASPSLNFMGQLLDFEATLDPDRQRSQCCRNLSNYSACTEQVFPDSHQSQQQNSA